MAVTLSCLVASVCPFFFALANCCTIVHNWLLAWPISPSIEFDVSSRIATSTEARLPWNGAFFTEKRFVSLAGQTPEWNRGAYLVEGLGHCSACHSPRNVFMAERTDSPYEGGVFQVKSTGKVWQYLGAA